MQQMQESEIKAGSDWQAASLAQDWVERCVRRPETAASQDAKEQ